MKTNIILSALIDVLFSGGTREDTVVINALKNFTKDGFNFEEDDGQLGVSLKADGKVLAIGYHMELCVWTFIYSELDPADPDTVLFETSGAVQFPLIEDHDQWSHEKRLFERLCEVSKPHLELFFSGFEVPVSGAFADLYRKPGAVRFTREGLDYDYEMLVVTPSTIKIEEGMVARKSDGPQDKLISGHIGLISFSILIRGNGDIEAEYQGEPQNTWVDGTVEERLELHEKDLIRRAQARLLQIHTAKSS